MGSEVRGSTGAMISTQRSMAHTFQRPDARHLRVDSSATVLRGIGGNVSLAKVAGNLRVGVAGGLKTPGFEPNDLGLMSRADVVHGGFWLGYESFALSPRTRARSAWLNTWHQTTTAGERTLHGARLFGRVQLRNFHAFATEFGLDGSALGVNLLRGGPALEIPTRLSHLVRYTSDTRRAVSLNVAHYYLRAMGADGYVHSITPDVTLRPTTRAEVTLGTQWRRNRLPWQFVGNASGADGIARSVVGDLQQRELSLTARVNYAFTPNVSLQLYAQPFVAAGRVAAFDEVVAPRAGRWTDRVRRFGSDDIERLPDHRVRLGQGDAAIAVDDPSFARAQFRSNAVLRWEYRPSSTVFVVWSQARDLDGDPDVQSVGTHGNELWGRSGTNVVTVKWTHYIKPSSAKETNLPRPITTWSWIGMSSSRPAATSWLVIALSSALGVGSPLGWLCTSTKLAARSAIASRNTSRGCTRLELRMPRLTSTSRSSRCCESSTATWNSSTVSVSIRGA